jgi:RNA polymerase sigma-70 factor (ECF subfamily)
MALPPLSRWLPRVVRGQGEGGETLGADALTYLNNLYSLALKLTRNQAAAEDLVQDTYLKAVRFAPSFKPGTNVKAWLFTILYNTFRNDVRGAMRDPVDVDSDALDTVAVAAPADNPERQLLQSVMDADLQAALDALPDQFRQAVWLRDVEECAYQEIAGILGVPIGTVMSRIARGRRLLHDHLLAARATSPIRTAPARAASDPVPARESRAGAETHSMTSQQLVTIATGKDPHRDAGPEQP